MESQRGLRGTLTAFVVFTCATVSGQTHRYWYDWTCKHRCDATLELYDVEYGSVVLKKPDGTTALVSLRRLDIGERRFLEACSKVADAAKSLARSPYIMSRVELDALRGRLIEKHIAESLAEDLAVKKNTPLLADRQLVNIRGRWVDIGGHQYEVVDARPSEVSTGIEELVVRLHNGGKKAVTPEWADTATLLPRFWKRPTYRFVSHTSEPEFLRHVRGPPSRSPVLPEFSWKYELEYDPIDSVWTDKQAAKGHGLIDQADRLWEQSNRLAVIAEAKWHVHRGDERLVAWVNNSNHHDLADAYTEYSQAIELVPNYADAYLRRGCVRMEAHYDRSALIDLKTAIQHDPKERHIVLPSLEMQARIYSRTPIEKSTIREVWARHTARMKEAKRLLDSELADARKRFADVTIDPATHPEHRETEKRELHDAAVSRAWGKLKTECDQSLQKHQLAVSSAKGTLAADTAAVTWMHDTAIATSQEAIRQAASGKLRETTEMLPPVYQGSPVEQVLLRLDSEQTDARYANLLRLVRSVAAEKTAAAAKDTAGDARAIVAAAGTAASVVAWSEDALLNAIERAENSIAEISDARELLGNVAAALAKRAIAYDATALEPSFSSAPAEWQSESDTWVTKETQLRSQRLAKYEHALASFYLAPTHTDTSVADARFGAALRYSGRGASDRPVPMPVRKIPTEGDVRPDYSVVEFRRNMSTAREALSIGDYQEAIDSATLAADSAPGDGHRDEAKQLISRALGKAILSISITPETPRF